LPVCDETHIFQNPTGSGSDFIQDQARELARVIPVQGVDGQTVAVLGLGRPGLSAARAMKAGGAQVICWVDNPAARTVAVDEGFETKAFERA